MRRPGSIRRSQDDGFMLLAVIVMIFLVLLALSVAAPRVAADLKRERELEAQHRANQYVRAIQLYYKKFGHYPSSLEQLDKSNNQRFLRAHYIDPLTGESDWRLIHVGENKTKVKGLFGEDLPGIGGAGIGTGIGSGTTAGSSSFGTSSFGATSSGTTGAGTNGTGTTDSGTGTAGTAGSSATGGSGTLGSLSVSDLKGSGGAIMGVGSSQSGASILTVNEQTDYSEWEFLYDPRIEQLKAKWSLFGGGIASGGQSNGLGTLNSSGPNGFPGTTTPSPTTNTGGTSGSTPRQ